MKAFLLAGGKGERLQPLTHSIPKPRVLIHGKPLIQRNIETLRESGSKDIIINLFYLGNKIEEFLGDGSKLGVEIRYSREESLLGTGGAIVNALDLIGNEPFLLMSSDIWTKFPFKDLSLPVESIAHLVLVEPLDGKGDLNLQRGLVNNLDEGPRYSYSGISIINPLLFYSYEKKNLDLWETFLKPNVDKGKVTGQLSTHQIINVNQLEDIQKIDDNIF